VRRRHKSKFDYYHELGVEETADVDQIKSAYRILAVRYHPDKNKHDDKSQAKAEARFKRISEAYEVLIDPVTRKLYDNYEHPAVRVPPKPGDKNTDGTKKSAESIPRRSPFVDFIKDKDSDKDVKFTGYQK
jgi:DnaJ-class molecular chaperone